jgi:hypothetical protein
VATITDNYIGSKLFFSPYEEGRREEYLKSKPTEMPSTPAKAADPIMDVAEPEAPAEDNDELDLDNLL